MNIKIIGCGLIGTSIALRLKEKKHEIWLEDSNSSNLHLAKDLVGISGELPNNIDLIIIATPLKAIIPILRDLNSIKCSAIVIEVGGIKSKVTSEVEALTDISENFVSAHPMAGREMTGPESARADLFEGRAWILTSSEKTNPKALEVAKKIGDELGSTTYYLDSKAHDETITAVSHLPQLLSSLLGNLISNDDEITLSFAGQGLRDISRLADSDSKLWSELFSENASNLLLKVDEILETVGEFKNALKERDEKRIENFLVQGKIGRSKIPGKHGAKARNYAHLPIVIGDKPGELARIFDECAACNVNVEDLSIEHSPNQETGLVTLSLQPKDAITLREHMINNGWLAQAIRINS